MQTDPGLLKAAIACGIAYVDVCDEPQLCEAGKALSAAASTSGTKAVTAAGIWPGVRFLISSYLTPQYLYRCSFSPPLPSTFEQK